MSRIIRTKSPAAERKAELSWLCTAATAIEESEVTSRHLMDLLAFVALGLQRVCASVEKTAAAWEGRDYWLKAERFRQEWSWAGTMLGRVERRLRQAAPISGEEALALLQGLRGQAKPRSVGKDPPWNGAFELWKGSQGIPEE